MSQRPPLPASVHRLITYALFATLALAGLVLEKNFHEMHLSKLLLFAAIGVWARELTLPARSWLLSMVALLWLLILVPWAADAAQQVDPRALQASLYDHIPGP